MGKILFITQLLPWPPYSGGKQKTSRVIELLLSLGHQVDVFCFDDETFKKSTIQSQKKQHKNLNIYSVINSVVTAHYQKIWKKIFICLLLSQKPFQVYKYWDERLVELISSKKDETYDVIWCDHDTSLQYLAVTNAFWPKAKRIYDEHNVMSVYAWRGIFEPRQSVLGRIHALIEWLKYLQYEKTILQWPDFIYAISQVDAHKLGKITKCGSIIKWLPIPYESIKLVKNSYDFDNILVLGTWSWPPNRAGLQWFYYKVWPLIREKNRKVKLIVAGQRLSGVRPWFVGDDSVSLIQPNENIESVYRMTTVVVVPIKSGGGVKIKLLEALSYGKPVVTTSIGAEGVFEDGGPGLVADNPSKFAAGVTKLLESQLESTQLSEKAHQFIEQSYSVKCALQVFADTKILEKMTLDRV